jgi:hypothetical protein
MENVKFDAGRTHRIRFLETHSNALENYRIVSNALDFETFQKFSELVFPPI